VIAAPRGAYSKAMNSPDLFTKFLIPAGLVRYQKRKVCKCGFVRAAIPTSKLYTSYHFTCIEAIGSGSVFPTHCNRFNRLKALCVQVEHFNLLHCFLYF